MVGTTVSYISGTSSQFLKADGSLDSNVYLTAEVDTLATVTARGATTNTSVIINAYLTVGAGADLYIRAAAASSDPGDIVFQDGSGAELHRLWAGTNTLNYRTNGGTTYLIWHSGNLTNLNQLSNGPGYITTAQTYYIGTTQNALNRASAAQTLTGVSIDGNSATTSYIYNPNYLTNTSNVMFNTTGSYYVGLVGNIANSLSIVTYTSASGAAANAVASYTLWHSGNDGSGSGLDADLLDGQHGSYYYAASNPNGYTTNTGTVTSVSGTGTVSGLVLTGTVTGSGSLTLGGTLSLTSANVTDALGYIPYNSTNPSGYITSSSLGAYLPLAGGTMTGNINWGQTDRGLVWSMNTDGAYIKFFNTGDGDTDSRLEYSTSDNNDEYHRWVIAGNERFTVKNSNSTVTGNFRSSGGISTGNHSLSSVYANFNTTTANGYLITTNIDYSTFNMPTVIIEGYAYGSSVPIHLEIVWYSYLNAFTNYYYTNLGSWDPGTVSIGTNGNGKVCIHLSNNIYYGRFNVRCIYDQGHAPLEGWSVSDASTSGLSRVTTVLRSALVTSITGNADTVDGYHESAFMRYYGYSTSGNFQTFQGTSGRVRFDQVGEINSGNWSNAPTGIYTYGGVLSYRGDNFGLQIYASHTGGMMYKTQWNDDQYSGWLRILDTQNYNSYAPTLTGGGASGTWGISISGNAATASTSSQVTINYGNDSNSTYYMLWGSGNSVYATGLIYCNPSTDTLYSRAYRGNSNVDGTGEASYHPAGLYSGGTNWLYGTLYMNGNNQRGIGGIVQNDIVARPNVQWGASGTTTGPVIIKFPGNSTNYGMVHVVIDIYEYNGNNVCTVIVGGHNWNGYWVNYGANVVGYTNKPVRVAFKDGQYCIVIGNASSSWEYGQVVLRKIQNGTYYSGVMEVGSGYTIGIESDSYTWVSSDLRTFRSSGNIYMNESLVATQSWVTSQGYITGYSETDTLATVTSRGSSTSGSITVGGNITVSSNNTTGGGIILADDGDIVDLNDAYCSMRFTSGVKIYSANRGGSAVITLGSNGVISASNISTGVTVNHIVQRDDNGYIYANHINFSTSETENPTISSFITSNGDGWSRKSSLAHVKNQIRSVADGTWGISISGNADTVDGYHASSFHPVYNQTLDLSGLDQSTYYPITIGLAAGRVTRMRIKNSLNSNVPSWSTHGSGFSLMVDWTSNGYGWGTIPIQRVVHNYVEQFANVQICGGLGQVGQASTEWIMLRGGGIYYFEADQYVSASIQTSTYTYYGESVSPTTSVTNTVWSSVTGSGISVTTLRANNWNGYSYATGSTANTFALRDSAGDVAAREFTLTASTVHTVTPSSITGIYPTTNQVVKFADTAVRTYLNVPTRTGGDASGTWSIDISGSAAMWGGYNTPTRTNWQSRSAGDLVVGQLSWKYYGNGHTIIDASAGTAPDGTSINNTNSAVAWTGSYPTLVGWNGSSTYGVRVDSSRVADNADTVDGYHASVANAASMAVVRDGSGDIFFRYSFSSYVNTTDDVNSGTITNIIAKFGDNYHRSASAAKVQSFLGLGSNAYTSTEFLPVAGGTMTGKIWTPSSGADAYGGAIEIRERGYALATQSAWSYSPALTFHWGNVTVKRFGLRYDGLFAVDDEPLALRSWVTSQGYITGYSETDTLATVTSRGAGTTGGITVNGTLTVGNSTSSYIYMVDTDETSRHIHCNSGRIGFLTSGGIWGSYCDNSGNWTSIGDITAYSDARVKENVSTIENALEKTLALRGVTYTRKDTEDKSRKVGVIAQEIQKVIPEVVSEQVDGMMGVSYGNLAGVFIEAIKEQQAQIEDLKKQIQYLVENR
jgi:hypothetical protein